MTLSVQNGLNLALWIVSILAIISYFLFARLVKIEHDNFYDQWEKDGKPHGIPFWYPSKKMGALGFRSYPLFISTLWLFKTPDWVINHPSAPKILRYYRFTSYIAFFVLFVMFVILVVSDPK
jgi:hypothetical protein